MSRKAYGGDNLNKARTAIKLYGGDPNDIARTVIKGYCGDSSNIARQFWPSANSIVGARTDLVAGGTYELNTCLPVMAVRFALEEIRKLLKPILNNYSIYLLYQQTKGDMLADFLQNQADNNFVYITCAASSYGDGTMTVSFYLGKADSLSRTINTVYTDSKYGNNYASITTDFRTTKTIQYSFNFQTKAVTRTSGTGTNIFNTIGLEIDNMNSGSYGVGHNLRVTNLGMTMYSIYAPAQGDWHWRFSGSTGFYDMIDHLKATTSDGSESSAIGRSNFIQLPAFAWEQGRTIKVKTEHFTPYWDELYDFMTIEDHGDDFHYYYRTEYVSESGGKHYYKCYYKVYRGGNIVGIYVSNSPQYSTHYRAFCVGQTTKPCLANNYNEQKGKWQWIGLGSSENEDLGEAGDLESLSPGGFQFNINLADNYIDFTLGGTANVTPPLTNKNYFRLGKMVDNASNTALASYTITEVEID